MGDAEQAVPPSKKRVAGRELNRDNPGLDDDAPEEGAGTFQRASDEVMATRRIVKVRRNQPPSTAPSNPSSNPFAGILLVPSTESAAKPNSATTDAPSQSNGDKTVSEEVDSTAALEKNDADKETEKGAGVNEANGSDVSVKKKETDRPPEEVVSDENSKKDGTDGQLDGVVADKENKPLVEEPVKDEKGAYKEEADEENKQLVEEPVKDKTEEPVKDKTGDSKEAVANEGKVDNASENTSTASAPLSSFQQLSSSQNAFTGLAGTGFSSSSFSFGSIPNDGTAFGGSFGSDNSNTSFPSYGLGSSNFGSSAASDATMSERGSLPTMQEVPVETGEENEKSVFTADAILFEYLDGSWKERGKGELKVNVSTTDAGKPRLVMRARGNYRLILNASLYPDMKLTNMDKRGITFACVNSASSEGKQGLTTFALKFKDGSIVDEFRGAVVAHKGKKDDGLKTPENSPKASDE